LRRQKMGHKSYLSKDEQRQLLSSLQLNCKPGCLQPVLRKCLGEILLQMVQAAHKKARGSP
jgi:hypothetical protein